MRYYPDAGRCASEADGVQNTPPSLGIPTNASCLCLGLTYAEVGASPTRKKCLPTRLKPHKHIMSTWTTKWFGGPHRMKAWA